MLNKILTSIFLGIVFVCSDDDEAVFTLTTNTFEDFLSSHPKVLVEFYAPWCGHCKALAPEYEQAAQTLAKDDSIDAVLAKVDATVENDLATKYGIKGFPTLKYFTGGDSTNPDDYSGGRTAATIVQWLQVRAMPAVSQVTSTEELNNFKAKSAVTLIGFLEEDSDEAKILSGYAEANRETVLVAQISDSAVAKDAGAKIGDVHINVKWEKKPIVFTGNKLTSGSLASFVNSERFPLVDAIGPENYKDYMDRGLPLVWVAVDGSDDETLKKVIDATTERARDFKGELSFVWVDTVKYEQHVQSLGITNNPGILIVGEPLKYKYDGDFFDKDALKKFFDEYKSGELKPFLKTQPEPESNDDSVYVLVGSTFKNIIGGDKDVFVEFYAPWCGHCKRLAPEYEKVGDEFADDDGIIIAKLDATENDTTENIKGFPTLIFYKAGSKEGRKFDGDRKADAIIEWINQNKSPATPEAGKTDL